MKLADSLPLIEKLPQYKSSQEVGAAFAEFVAAHGFLATACGESRDTPEGRSWEFFFNTWPADWLLQYQKNDFVRHDLLPMVARYSAQTFTFLEAMRGRTLTAKQRELHEWTNGLGIVDAIAVPFHYPGGDLGLCVSLANHPIDDRFERNVLQMVSLFTYQRCRELGGQSEASMAPRLLTRREADCMRWVLKGKSDTDIASILEISHTTVKFHIDRVKKKLDVKTRTQAVAALVSLGYL